MNWHSGDDESRRDWEREGAYDGMYRLVSTILTREEPVRDRLIREGEAAWKNLPEFDGSPHVAKLLHDMVEYIKGV